MGNCRLASQHDRIEATDADVLATGNDQMLGDN